MMSQITIPNREKIDAIALRPDIPAQASECITVEDCVRWYEDLGAPTPFSGDHLPRRRGEQA